MVEQSEETTILPLMRIMDQRTADVLSDKRLFPGFLAFAVYVTEKVFENTDAARDQDLKKAMALVKEYALENREANLELGLIFRKLEASGDGEETPAGYLARLMVENLIFNIRTFGKSGAENAIIALCMQINNAPIALTFSLGKEKARPVIYEIMQKAQGDWSALLPA